MEISIIITSYNYGKFLERAIRSAINQNYLRHRFEIIVVDDGSTDESRPIINNYKNEVVSILFDENKGLPAARNAGIRKARGQFLVNLDADDYMHSDLIYIESFFLRQNPNWDAVGCDYYLVDDDERHLKRVNSKRHPIACGIMFRKERLIAIGLYDEQFLLNEDQDLRIRFLQKYNIKHIELPLYRYRQHDHNLTSNKALTDCYNNILSEKHPGRF